MPDSEVPSIPAPSSTGFWDYAPGCELLERYTLTRPMAEGGTAVVWVARDRVLDVEVAVKIVHRPKAETSESLNRRALTEARLSAQLTHPAVCRVIDFGFTERGDPLVVSELLSGETLEHLLLRKDTLSPVRAVGILLPILDALSAAHERGIVHRDVKPANIFLSSQADGRVEPKLLDFGIARWVNDETRTTTTGAVCGTPCYMSTEQARGSKDVDFRSDIWSSCATLYELVTGNPPFDGENYNAVLWSILNTEPPSIASLGVADTKLSQIVERGLAKAADERWESVAALADELTRWLLAQGAESDAAGRALRLRLTAPPAAPSVYKAVPRVVAFVAMGAIAAAASLWLAREARSNAPEVEEAPFIDRERPRLDFPEAVNAAVLPVSAADATRSADQEIRAPAPTSEPEREGRPLPLPNGKHETKPSPRADLNAPAEPAPPKARPPRPAREGTNAMGYDFGL